VRSRSGDVGFDGLVAEMELVAKSRRMRSVFSELCWPHRTDEKETASHSRREHPDYCVRRQNLADFDK
jgi:hypothetical protein